MYLIKREKGIEIPLGIGIGGQVTLVRRDMRSGMIDKVIGPEPNTLLDNWLDEVMTNRSHGILGWHYGGAPSSSNNRSGGCLTCFGIGSSDQVVDKTVDDNLVSPIGKKVVTTLVAKSIEWAIPIWVERMAIFPAGDTYVGTIKEVATCYNTNVGASNKNVAARHILSEPLIKTNYHQVELYWKLTLDRITNMHTKVITGGGKLGEDITINTMINDKQLFNIGAFGGSGGSSGSTVYVANSLRAFFQNLVIANNYVLGDSNAASSLSDDHNNLKGTKIFNSTPITDYTDYTPGSLRRDVRWGFDVDVEGDIGEFMVMADVTYAPGATRYYHGYIFRSTFTPKLEKDSDYRLFFDYSLQLQRLPAMELLSWSGD